MRRGWIQVPLRVLPLVVVTVAGTAGAQPLALPAVHPAETPSPPQVEEIRVHKAARTMELVSDGHVVRVIDHIQLGSHPVGKKHFEGDGRTPEGHYTIDWGNPDSAYHLALHISYPDAEDLAYATRRRRSAGGMIMIHGQPDTVPGGRVKGDWTDGCISVSDAEIEALWKTVPDDTPIEILP